MSPGAGNGGSNQSTIVASMMEVQRLREENSLHKATLASYEEKLAQAMNVSPLLGDSTQKVCSFQTFFQ